MQTNSDLNQQTGGVHAWCFLREFNKRPLQDAQLATKPLFLLGETAEQLASLGVEQVLNRAEFPRLQMLELILLALDGVNTRHHLHLKLPLKVPDLSVLAFDVAIDFASQSFLLVDSKLQALQDVRLVSRDFLGFELI